MKHFNDGNGNIRMNGDRLEVFNENGWVNMDKNKELNRLTVNNAEELIRRYGERAVVGFFKDWYNRLDMSNNKNTEEYKEVKKMVENVVKKHTDD